MNKITVILSIAAAISSSLSFPNGASTTGTGATIGTIRKLNISGTNIVNSAIAAGICLINKLPGTAEDKASKIANIKKNQIIIEKRRYKYNNDCNENDRVLFFEYENCMLESCNRIPEGRTEDQIRSVIAEDCSHGERLASKLSRKCWESITNKD